MSHDDLCARAVRWLKGTGRCVLAVEDLSWWGGECPDAIGWDSRGLSTLIECKTSRNDFHADKRKVWRRAEYLALGRKRFYMAPKGVLKVDDMPEKWGLLEVRGKIVRRLKDAEPYMDREATAHHRESRLLVNIARRLGNEQWSDEMVVCK